MVGAALVVGLLAAALASGADDPGESETYTVLDVQQTSDGVEAVVSVRAGGVPEDVLQDVLREHTYARVTMTCEGTDLDEDGWVLQGAVEDGRVDVVVPYADRAC
ncbi:hypothetical protein NOZE110980_06155 [Nocardioides zeicaulis]